MTGMTRWTFPALGLVGVALACASSRATGRAARASFDTNACADISEDERRSSPLEAPYTIESIAPVHRYQWTGRGAQRRPVQGTGKMTGMFVTLHTPDPTTVEALEARLQCHIAWMRSSGAGSPTVRSCPLAVPGISAEVRMGHGDRFILALQSKDERAAKEAWRRARALLDTGEGSPADGEDFE